MSVAGLKRDDDCCIQMTAYWFAVLFSAILDMSAQGFCGMAENQSGTKKKHPNRNLHARQRWQVARARGGMQGGTAMLGKNKHKKRGGGDQDL